jgi:hypothetical protein
MKNAGSCVTCKCEVWIPDALYEAASASRGPFGIQFFCGYGHRQHYVVGETEAEKFRRQRDQLAQRLAERDDEIARQRGLREETERRLTATRGVVTRIKNRVGHGVCPCCTRSFQNLARHMAAKHPSYAAEDAAA